MQYTRIYVYTHIIYICLYIRSIYCIRSISYIRSNTANIKSRIRLSTFMHVWFRVIQSSWFVVKLRGISGQGSAFFFLLWFKLAHICIEVTSLHKQARNVIRWRPGQEASLAPPYPKPEVFRKQMYCIEESTCDIDGTFWRRPQSFVSSRSDSAPPCWFGARKIFPPLPPPGYAPIHKGDKKWIHRQFFIWNRFHVTLRILNLTILFK